MTAREVFWSNRKQGNRLTFQHVALIADDLRLSPVYALDGVLVVVGQVEEAAENTCLSNLLGKEIVAWLGCGTCFRTWLPAKTPSR